MNPKIKPWLVLALIFVLGMVTGGALTFVLGPHFLHPPGARDMRTHWMRHLTERLNLTADQQAKIDPILTEAGNQLQAVHRDEVGRVSQIMEKANTEIATILTPGQQTLLQAMQKEMHMKSWGPHGEHGEGPPHGGPGNGMPPDQATNAAPEPKR